MAEHRLYMTTDKNLKGKGLIAIITQGHFRLGDDETIVLELTTVPNYKAAKQWFKRMKKERPWEMRQ